MVDSLTKWFFENPKHLSTFFNCPFFGLGLYRASDKSWISVSDTLCDMLGYSHEEIWPLTWVDLTHPDDLQKNLTLFDSAVASGMQENYALEKRFIRKDESDLAALVQVIVHRDSSGSEEPFNLMIVQDLSAQKAAEAKLKTMVRQQEQVIREKTASLEEQVGIQTRLNDELAVIQKRMNAALECMNDGFALYDQNDRLVLWNKRYAEIYKETSDLLIRGATFSEIASACAWQGLVREALGREEEWIADRIAKRDRSQKTEYQLSDGTWISATDQKTPDGGYVCLRVDISELKKAHHDAEAANKAKSEFLARMSHEIRTPMTGILGLADMLSRSSLTGEQRDLLKNIRTSGNLLMEILNEVLDQSKIDAGKLEIERVTFQFRPVLESVISNFNPIAVDKGVSLNCTVDNDIPDFVCGDPTRIRQVLFNLVGNAIKFTAQGRVDIFATRGEGDRIEFSVQDTGIGIDRNRMDFLFLPFEQADKSTSRSHGGTGLGLTIAKHLIELMGGGIQVSSELNVGSKFSFYLHLPRAENPDSGPAVAAAREFVERPLRILVADDNEINQMVVEAVLQERHHSCAFANDGEEAVEVFKAGEFDLVLMDIRMPKVDGIEAFKRIREFENGREKVPIIALTADVTEDHVREYRETGFDGVAYKPIDPEVLFALIGKVMSAGAP
jgi:PAS domain S-box-containing protein